MAEKGQLTLDSETREKLIIDNMWIVDYLARKFSGNDTSLYEELKSVGNIGLVKAADHYSEEKGTSFPTYATLLIQGEIRHYLRDKADVVRIPRKYVSYYKAIQEAINGHISRFGSLPTVKEIAYMTGLSSEIVLEALEAGFAKFPISMEESLISDEENIKVKDTVADSTDETANVIDKITLNRALQKLNDIERKSIELKYKSDLTNTEIAEKLGINPGKVNRSIKKGLNKLKQYLDDE